MILPKTDDFKEIHVWSGDTLEVSDLEKSFYNKYLETLEKGDAILDIGCGQGKLVNFLQDKGYKSAGIDLNAEIIETAIYQGLPVQKMDALTAIQTEACNYNVFSMLDFVEHIPLNVFI
jgi:2-polyprenyl-3-methyl-5-hydroxy-6-metoxy-1,4-benzoquinol methylase